MKPTREKLRQIIKELEAQNSRLLHENEVLNQVLNSAVPFCIIDKKNNVLEVNSTFCSFFGFNKKDVLGRKCYNIWQNEICKTPDCPLEAILSGKNCSESEMECEVSNGDQFFCIVTAKPYRDPDGGLIGITESFVDIADRKRAEDALKEQDKRLRSVLENMPVLMVAFDEDKKILVWNRECERVTGYSSEEVLHNSSALELLYPDKKYRRLVEDKLTHPVNDYHNWEFDIFCKEGSPKTIAWSNISSNFPVAGFSSWLIGIDVTERTSNEKTLRMREHDLAEKTTEVEKMNTALQVMLKKMEGDKEDLERKVLLNFNSVIKPLFDNLISSRLTKKQEDYVQSILTNIENIISPFTKELSAPHYGLTSTEIMVANYIREGKSSKEIAELMHLSKRTVDVHRTHIRKKIGSGLKNTSLRAFLLALCQ